MGGLQQVLETLLKNNPDLRERLKQADTVQLNYTPRLKHDKEEWVVELRTSYASEANIPAKKWRSHATAHALLIEEAKGINEILTRRLPGYHAKLIGYYWAGSLDKEHCYGQLI